MIKEKYHAIRFEKGLEGIIQIAGEALYRVQGKVPDAEYEWARGITSRIVCASDAVHFPNLRLFPELLPHYCATIYLPEDKVRYNLVYMANANTPPVLIKSGIPISAAEETLQKYKKAYATHEERYYDEELYWLELDEESLKNLLHRNEEKRKLRAQKHRQSSINADNPQ